MVVPTARQITTMDSKTTVSQVLFSTQSRRDVSHVSFSCLLIICSFYTSRYSCISDYLHNSTFVDTRWRAQLLLCRKFRRRVCVYVFRQSTGHKLSLFQSNDRLPSQAAHLVTICHLSSSRTSTFSKSF